MEPIRGGMYYYQSVFLFRLLQSVSLPVHLSSKHGGMWTDDAAGLSVLRDVCRYK